MADEASLRNADEPVRAGFRTLRFWNSDVNTNLEGVVETILHALGAIEDPTSLP